ncbi:DUF1688 family protein, partial [Bosea sp. (in: a-proteobacteria)]|uniref:DUF1688 family protein n=1 Tax=Bosea sp. (in: a-proteobacteria) TaxID=1871050 RepID=UPI001AC1AD39
MPDSNPEAVRQLLKPAVIRERAQEMLQLGLDGRLSHFSVHPERLDACTDYVLATIRRNYPTLDIPFHARWRHFVVAGVDRWRSLDEAADQAVTDRDTGTLLIRDCGSPVDTTPLQARDDLPDGGAWLY